MFLAPAAFAPWIAFDPMPPAPMTTTVSPGLTSPAYTEEPQPVVTPHPTSAACFSGMSSSILMQLSTFATACEENVPIPHIFVRPTPALLNTLNVPSPWMIVAPLSHRFVLPIEHQWHFPQLGMKPNTM